MSVDRADPRGRVLVVGSANLDLVARAERHPLPGETVLGDSYSEHAGGKGLNQAVAASRSGADTALVAAVGGDPAGDTLLAVAEASGIDVTGCVRHDRLPTGRAMITVDRDGENSIVVIPGANAALSAPRTLVDGGVVLAQLEVPIETVAMTFALARRSGLVTILNPAPAHGLPDELLADCTIVIPNQHEVETLGGVDRLLGLGVETVITTLGGDGVAVHDASGRRSVSAWEVTPVDTTGAGDTFCGAVAARLAVGHPLETAIEWAAAAAALATTVAGAVPSIPTAGQVEAFMSTARRRA
jgi:ribokinase